MGHKVAPNSRLVALPVTWVPGLGCAVVKFVLLPDDLKPHFRRGIVGLVWDDPMRGTPWNYISRCGVALTAYENSGELPPGWMMPPVRSEDDDPNEPFDPDEPLPEPPETLNVLEHQRYISRLIHWGFETSKRERSRPHLVERDNYDEDDLD